MLYTYMYIPISLVPRPTLFLGTRLHKNLRCMCKISSQCTVYHSVLPLLLFMLSWSQEYEAYYYVKFKKAPKITKKLATGGRRTEGEWWQCAGVEGVRYIHTHVNDTPNMHSNVQPLTLLC